MNNDNYPVEIVGADITDITAGNQNGGLLSADTDNILRLADKADVYPSTLSGGQKQRIAIIRALAEGYGPRFVGGLKDSPLSREYAPELIVSNRLTDRKQYLRILHDSDICIASTGLHESIGWKTGEYVAAAKAIVNERLHYSVTGNFAEGVHYLSFETVEECLNAVQKLVEDPQLRFAMKEANAEYYRNYLRPDMIVRNSLELVDEIIAEEQKKEIAEI